MAGCFIITARLGLHPASDQALRETLDEAGSGDVMVAGSLLNSLNLALTEALGDVFTALWVAVALSFAVALSLYARPDTDHRAHSDQR